MNAINWRDYLYKPWDFLFLPLSSSSSTRHCPTKQSFPFWQRTPVETTNKNKCVERQEDNLIVTAPICFNFSDFNSTMQDDNSHGEESRGPNATYPRPREATRRRWSTNIKALLAFILSHKVPSIRLLSIHFVRNWVGGQIGNCVVSLWASIVALLYIRPVTIPRATKYKNIITTDVVPGRRINGPHLKTAEELPLALRYSQT